MTSSSEARNVSDTSAIKIRSIFKRRNAIRISGRSECIYHKSCKIFVLFFPGVLIAISAVSCTPSALPQTASSPRSAVAPADVTLPDDPSASKTEVRPAVDPSTAEGEQTKRIFGIIPQLPLRLG